MAVSIVAVVTVCIIGGLHFERLGAYDKTNPAVMPAKYVALYISLACGFLVFGVGAPLVYYFINADMFDKRKNH